jgi:hypothetical protein
MEEIGNAHKIEDGKPEGKGTLGRPRRTWKDSITIISSVYCVYATVSNATFILVSHISPYDMFRHYMAIIKYISIFPKLFHSGCYFFRV